MDPNFLGAAAVQPYERKRGDPIYRPLRIYTLDPTPAVSTERSQRLTFHMRNLPLAQVAACSRSWTGTRPRAVPTLPVDLDEKDVLLRNGRDPSLSDAMFHQQMVYAVCSSTYNVFRAALGRVPSWGFLARPGAARPELRIRPHALYDENAYYDDTNGELNFGYFDASKTA